MRKTGFTLIELLAVIVILAIILAIAIPSINTLVNNAKLNAYSSQVGLILDAADNYTVSTNNGPTLGSEKIITLNDLQTNGYISNNIKDARTDTTIPSNTWIVIDNNSGAYKYTWGYATSGLLIQYDGINNGGIGIHNSNASANKGIWKDLSGNNNDGALSNYLYDSTSGWTSTGLRSAVGTFGSVLQSTTFSGLQSFTVEIAGIFNANIASANWPRIVGTNGGYTASYQGINGVDLTANGANTFLVGTASDGTPADAVDIDDIGNFGTMDIAIVWDYNAKKIIIYRDGTKINEFNVTAFTNVNFNKLGMGHGRSANSGEYIYDAVLVYNRALTASEINYNYNTDKVRYNLN